MVTSKTPISMVKPAADASVNSQSIGFHRHSSLTTVTGVGKFRTLQSVNSRHHRQDARQASIGCVGGGVAGRLKTTLSSLLPASPRPIFSTQRESILFRPGSSSPLNRLKLQSRLSAPTGLTKSNAMPLRNMRAAHRLQPGNLRAANGVKRRPASPRLTHFDAHARYPGGFGKAKGETPGCTGGRMTINKQSGPGHG
jgi:hypothetical protein